MRKYEAQQNDKGHKLQIPKTLLCRKPISCYSIKSWLSQDPEPFVYSKKGIILRIKIYS